MPLPVAAISHFGAFTAIRFHASRLAVKFVTDTRCDKTWLTITTTHGATQMLCKVLRDDTET
jgi:hypothetical protein